MITGYCRDCLAQAQGKTRADLPKRCPACGSPRMLVHDELESLSIAHIDCDAFFAAVEKLDNPDLRDKPVIVGGGQRGVVSTCCYIARIHGVHSAMPMFTARKLCPDAVIVKPNMKRYVEVGQEIRQHMLALTPLVEPLSIDEAFLDLTGTERLHDGSPALTLLRFAKSIEEDIGVTVSVGLSHNKSMAKMASDMDSRVVLRSLAALKPSTFSHPCRCALFGVGAAMARSLEKKGYATLADLQAAEPERLWRSFGEHGARLHDLASGIDPRPVRPDRERKSVSSERTFNEDIVDLDALRVIARGASERVAKQLKAKHFSGRTVTLKIKTAAFKTLTRSHSLPTPTQSADRIFRTVEPMLQGVVDGTRFRLLGVGVSELMDAEDADDRDLADADAQRRTEAEKAMDSLRARFGDDAVGVGLVFGQSAPKQADHSASRQSKDHHSTQADGRNASKSASTPRSENDP